MMEPRQRRLLVLGAGTAGTMVANRIRRRLPDWSVIVVDRDDVHGYQPGYLFIPFGARPEPLRKPRRRLLAPGVVLAIGEIDRVDPQGRTVTLCDGRALGYDYLVVATGTTPRPDQTPGMLGPEWHRGVGEFYTYDGALALARRMARSPAGAWSCTSPRCRSSAQWHHWSSRSWPTTSCGSGGSATPPSSSS